ncbi:MAG TPA: hypothetical protein VF133_01145 [Terriglobales bacterium]
MFALDPHTLSNALRWLTKQKVSFSLILIGLTAGVLLVGQTRTARTIEAERFVLRGTDGSVRAKLEAANDSTELAFYNSAGNVRVAIKVASDGEGLEMRDDAGRLLALVNVGVQQNAPSSTTSTIAILGNKGGPGVILNATQEIAVARVDDATGHRVWAAESTPGKQSR